MSKTIKETVAKLSQYMDYLELHCENKKLRSRITQLERMLRDIKDESDGFGSFGYISNVCKTALGGDDG